MTRLHHEIAGDGPPVVLLHAFPFDRRMWQAQATALAARHFMAVSVDLAGFGRSAPATGANAPDANTIVDSTVVDTIEEHAIHVAGLIDALHFFNVHLVGLSLGGYVALAFARRYPHRLTSLVLADTRATPDSPDEQARRDKAIAKIDREGASAYLDELLPKLYAPDTPATVQSALRKIADAQTAPALKNTLAAMRDRDDTTAVLRTLEAPLLLVGGERDLVTPPTKIREMQAAQPDAELVIIAGAGHLSACEAPDPFNDALLRFFESLRH